ncbi:MAG TPA: DUF6569 family protein [Gemmata sp.]|nr:DUF6569 family protein [Gemmata sp.]
MKSSQALGMVILAIGGLWFAGGGFTFRSAAAAEELKVSDPIAHANLTVFFIHGPDTVANARIMTLQEALETGRAIVHETGNVNSLTVENLSTDTELFLQDGDIIRGGRQDRLVALDLLVPPKSGIVSFPCNCVEHGRWAGRENEAATHFSKSDQFAVGQKLKIANTYHQQSVVWSSVAENNSGLARSTGANVTANASPSSLQLALESPAVKANVAAYETALKAEGENREGVIGAIFIVNGVPTGHEIYCSNALFKKAWPKLLRSASTEALMEKKDRPVPATPTVREVERYLALAGKMDTASASNRPGENSRPRDNFIVNEVIHVQPSGPEGSLERFISERITYDVYRPQTAALPAQTEANRVGRVLIEGNAVTQDRVVLNDVGLQSPISFSRGGNTANPQPSQSQAPQSNGNRLNVNRVENASGLMSESRDPTRQNAVIHRSFIKK